MSDLDQAKHTYKFWLGNLLLSLALIMLIYLGDLWATLGNWTMALWLALAGVGMYLVMQDQGPSSNMPN